MVGGFGVDVVGAGLVGKDVAGLAIEDAAERVQRWKNKEKPPGRNGRKPDEGGDPNPQEWLALATFEVVLPAIREELAELRSAAADGDEDAFQRFQSLSREAVTIERRAREATLDATRTDEDDADGLVA